MPLPSLRALLKDLDRTTHAGRCRIMASLAAGHRGDAGLGRLLDEVEGQSDYHARLVTIAARVAGDTERLQRLTLHHSPGVAATAGAALPLGDLSVDAGVALYLNAPAAQRRSIRRRYVTARRTDVVDALVTRAGLADRERARLLAAAGEDVVRAHLEDLGALVPSPESLARRHPRPVLDLLLEKSHTASVPEQEWWWHTLAPALPVLGRLHPGRMLEVIEARDRGLPTSVDVGVAALVRHDPHRVATLLLQTPRDRAWSSPRGVVTEARRFSETDRHRVVRYLRECGTSPRHDEQLVAAFLDALPPSQRAAAFDAAYEGVALDERELSSALLLTLPHAARHAQARRMLGRRGVSEQVEHSAYLSGYLPADEAAERLAPVTRSRSADERAGAHAARLRAAGHDRDPVALSEALTRLDELRNEQDPVRAMAATALAGVPPEPLVAADLGPLAGFTHEVATARDSAPATLRTLVTTWWRVTLTAISLGRDDVTRLGLDLLLELHEPHGLLSIPPLTRLPHGRERVVVDALLPRLEAVQRRDEPHLLFALCRALGERAWDHPELQALLERSLHVRSSGVVRSAAELWLDDRRARAQRVEAALRVDQSLAVLPVVQHILSTSRQDLLDVLWKPSPLRGRLWGKRMRYVPLLDGPFGRWLPRQVEAYAAALRNLLGTPATPTWTRMRAIHTLGRLPEVGTAALEPYLTSDEVPLQEAALAALAHADRPGDALRQLLAVRSGDRVRVAMYAAARSARYLPEAQVWPLLLEVLDDPATKVTARKEAVRLLGSLRAGEAVDRVVVVGLADDTHRDVRAAAGRALLTHLDDVRAWEVLRRVAASGRDGALSVLEARPRLVAARHRTAYGQLVVEYARLPEPAVVGALSDWAPWLPDGGRVLTDLVLDLTWPHWQSALVPLRQVLRHGRGWGDVQEAALALAGAAGSPSGPAPAWVDGGGRRDLPQRQRLAALVGSVSDWDEPERATHAAALRALSDALLEHPDAFRPALQAAAGAVDWAAPGDDLAHLVAAVTDPLRCLDLREAVADALLTHPGVPTHGLGSTVDGLLAEGTVAAGVTALAVIDWAGERTGWTEPWTRRLTGLRAHPSPVVASWARDVVTAPE